MKALTTAGLTKLIQLIKSNFISTSDTVTTNTVTLATVATSGSYNDLSNKPTIPTVDQTYDGSSANAQSGVAIEGELANYQSKLVSGTNIKTINNTSLLDSGNIDTSEIFVAEYDVTTFQQVLNAYNSGKTIFVKSADTVRGYMMGYLYFANNTYFSFLIYERFAANYAIFDEVTLTQAGWNVSASRTFADTDLSNLSATGETKIDNSVLAILDTLYPIGSIYIGTMATCPLATLGIGTWTLVSSGKVLQGADSTHTAGSTIAAGLPEISGNIQSRSYTTQYSGAITGASGAFSYTRNATSGTTSPVSVTGTAVKGDVTQFHASNSNSIYGNSTTVQPPAYAVNIWERTA